MCNTIHDLSELINTLEELQSERYILGFRGQSSNWEPIPVAARCRTNLSSPDFENFVNEFRQINDSISHNSVALTFTEIFIDAFDQYRNYAFRNEGGGDNITNHDLIQILFQALRQQYSRTALMLDISFEPRVALFMSLHEFRSSLITDDYRLILRAQRHNNLFVYLSVFKIPNEMRIVFDENPNVMLDRLRRCYENRLSNNGYFAIDLSNINNFSRLRNQASGFLSYFPSDNFSHNVTAYDFSNVFEREVYRLNTNMVIEYLENNNQNISMFPHEDFSCQWANQIAGERIYACRYRQRLERSDLGISIYQYFPDQDNLYI